MNVVIWRTFFIVARLLSLKPQVDLNEKNRLGDNALHLASSKGSKECIVLLRNTGKMDVFENNSEGKSPYELAKEPEAKEVLKNWMKEFQGNKPQDYEYEQSDDDEDDDENWNTCFNIGSISQSQIFIEIS